jgi:DNA repair protein RadC
MKQMTLPFKELFDADDTADSTKRLFIRRIEARYSKECIREDTPSWVSSTRYTSPAQVYELFNALRYETKEHFVSLLLDGKNRIIAVDKVSVGTLNQSLVHPREVFKTAVLSAAAAIILVHNHPTGDTTPSAEDKDVTTRLKAAGDILGIRILDHVIIGDDYYSFTEHLLMH